MLMPSVPRRSPADSHHLGQIVCGASCIVSLSQNLPLKNNLRQEEENRRRMARMGRNVTHRTSKWQSLILDLQTCTLAYVSKSFDNSRWTSLGFYSRKRKFRCRISAFCLWQGTEKDGNLRKKRVKTLPETAKHRTSLPQTSVLFIPNIGTLPQRSPMFLISEPAETAKSA